MTMACLSIQTPAGLVEVGDTVTVDLSNDPVARSYGWPKRASGRVVSAHSGCLNVALEGLTMGFMFSLGADNASMVVKVVKG